MARDCGRGEVRTCFQSSTTETRTVCDGSSSTQTASISCSWSLRSAALNPSSHSSVCTSSSSSYLPLIQPQSSSIWPSSLLPSAARPFSQSPTSSSSMETFELLARDDGVAMVDSYGDSAFIVNGVLVSHHALLCFGGTSLLLDARTIEQVNIETAAALLLIKPVPEIVVFGTGRKSTVLSSNNSSVDKEDKMKKRSMIGIDQSLRDALRKQGSAVEVMATNKAAALFNILNQEGRRIAAILVPAGTDHP